MLLYAGTISKLYIYSIQIKYKNIVTKIYSVLLIINILRDNPQIIILNWLKIIVNTIFIKYSPSGCAAAILNMRISETLCNSVNINYNKTISNNPSNAHKPLNDAELGHYLAGLIDGDGHLSKIGQLVIAYDEKDKSAAYWLKKIIGYGSVSKIKDKKGYKYVLAKSDGIIRVIDLVNGKLRTEIKYNQVLYLLNNNNLISQYSKPFTMNTSTDFNNFWLTGFIDSDGSFQIKTVKHIKNGKEHTEIRLKLQISQKYKNILEDIKKFLIIASNSDNNSSGGIYIGTRKHINKETKEIKITYYFETTSFSIFKKVINYIDNYPLISYKRLNYMWIRKAYLLIQSKEHITPEGLQKIIDYKNKMKY